MRTVISILLIALSIQAPKLARAEDIAASNQSSYAAQQEELISRYLSQTAIPSNDSSSLMIDNLADISQIGDGDTASINQNGSYNRASIIQSGGTQNTALITQAGNGNVASISQQGSHNLAMIYQH